MVGHLKVPVFKIDEEAEAFLEQDLSDLDLGQFVPSRFIFPKALATQSTGSEQEDRDDDGKGSGG